MGQQVPGHHDRVAFIVFLWTMGLLACAFLGVMGVRIWATW